MIAPRAACAAAALVVLAGCSTLAKAPRPRPHAIDPAWTEVRDRFSRQARLYDGFLHRANATATYLSPEVREARARQLAKWLSWSDVELAQRLAEEQADAARFDEFVVSFFAADFISNDLDAPRSIWRLAVELPDRAVLPTLVRSVDRDATITTLYPWVGRFDTVYVLRFPRQPELASGKFVLMIASAMGQLPLDYGVPGGIIRLPDQAP